MGPRRVRALAGGAAARANEVRTTKYTRASFLPRSLALQYRRFGNIFFTVVVVIMLLGTYTRLFQSPQAPWGNMSVLLLIFALNMTNEYRDDRARRRKDLRVNSRPVKVFDPALAEFVTREWAEVAPGDLVRLDKGNTSPADIVVLTCSDADLEPVCYVETANVDGETYLKKRLLVPELAMVVSGLGGMGELSAALQNCELELDAPSESLSTFGCRIHIHSQGSSARVVQLGADNAILRGAQLRNTDWVWGLVAYVGKDTKILLSDPPRDPKSSKVDHMVNTVIFTVIILLSILLIVSVICALHLYTPAEDLWYMRGSGEAGDVIAADWLALLLAFIVLYRQILPILLYAVQEGLNVMQANYIKWDLNMMDPETGKHASCNTTALAQEIGQVKWIFSDKTGTLTRNEMRLVSIFVDGKTYGCANMEALQQLGEKNLPPLAAARDCFADVSAALRSDLSKPGEVHKHRLDAFLRGVSLCHTVLVESALEENPDPMLHASTVSAPARTRDSTKRLRRSMLSSRNLKDQEAMRNPYEGSMRSMYSSAESSHNEQPANVTTSRSNFARGSLMTSSSSSSVLSAVREASSYMSVNSGVLGADPMSPPPNTGSPAQAVAAATAAAASVVTATASAPATRIPLPERLPEYNAESPDEEALVLGAYAMGYRLAYTSGATGVGIKTPPLSFPEVRRGPECENWEVLAINPFNSDRKRMSVAYRNPNDGTVLLVCKGADNQMLAVTDPASANLDTVRDQLDAFARDGLRTLVLARRVLSEEEFQAWAVRHQAATKAIGSEKKRLLDEAACEVERDLEFLGITAVEDRLQEGVPDTIQLIRDAGINFWLITGDKVETAINIGLSANLLRRDQQPEMLTVAELRKGMPDNSADLGVTVAERVKQLVERLAPAPGALTSDLVLFREEEEEERRGCLLRIFDCFTCRKPPPLIACDPNMALVVDGEVLQHIINKPCEAGFLEFARRCAIVIACRTSPCQKADLVALVKENVLPKPVTLAIGDGANDVPMIQKGNVGVGISGKEGTHAAAVADFTISQFRFLGPLLLVHGRLGYIRMAKAISLIFYGNLLFTFTSFYFNFYCRFSAQPAFSNLQYILFQALIAVPVFAIGYCDRDTPRVYDVMNQPELYGIGLRNLILHPATVDGQILRGLAYGLLTLVLVIVKSYDLTLAAISTQLFLALALVMTERQVRVADGKTWFLLFAAVFNVVVAFVTVGVNYALAKQNIFKDDELLRSIWNRLLAVVTLVLATDLAFPRQFRKLRVSVKKVHKLIAKNRLQISALDSVPTNRLFVRDTVGIELRENSMHAEQERLRVAQDECNGVDHSIAAPYAAEDDAKYAAKDSARDAGKDVAKDDLNRI